MRLDPRAELLRVWEAVARYSFRDGGFLWGDPATGDALEDAHQLLCILGPAANLPGLRLDVPGETADDAAGALRALGDRFEIPERLVVAMREYLTRYSDGTGAPVFPGGPSLEPPAPAVETVAGFSADLRLCLAMLGFCRVYRQQTADVERLAEIRLTVAMTGLLRAYSVRASADDTHLRHLVRPGPRDEQAVRDEFAAGLVEVQAGLREISIGALPDHDAVYRGAWFECGWAWTVVAGALSVDLDPLPDGVVITQRSGPAMAPQLYSTLLALHAVDELFTERTRILGLLTEDQQRLARALQLRSDLTGAYWAWVATFGEHRWPLERVPWRTADGDESLHNSAVVAALTSVELGTRRGNQQLPYAYLLRVLAGLAARHGVARPPLAAPPPAVLPEHRCPCPGLPGTTQRAVATVPILFRVAVRAATAVDDGPLRTGFEDLADQLWQHLPLFPAGYAPNWHDTLHAVDALTLATRLTSGVAPPAPALFVHELLTTAETLAGEDHPVVARARGFVDTAPARAAALLYRLVADLDRPD
ncbi:SCO2524 family protein [Dactylosporangium sp. NPDC050588]|uniref:SCO2524 family protein n=1 Tax=Dactylosporangium sp. NPDC050588 TaxID=3157211 RepID=UPI0033D9BC4B